MLEKPNVLRLTLPAPLAMPVMVQLLSMLPKEDYQVYERAPCWYLALGTRASLTIDATGDHAQVVTAAGEQQIAVVDSPAQCARRFLSEHAKHARVYGEAGFNYAPRTRGQAFTPGRWPILALVVPEDEMIFEGDTVTIIARDAQRACQLGDWVNSAQVMVQPLPTTDAHTAPVEDVAERDDDYCWRITQAQQDITAGRYDKIILSRALSLNRPLNMAATLLRGRQANTPVRTFLLRRGVREAVGFSPELVMSVEQGRVVTDPLAGTCRRQVGEEADNQASAALQRNSKEVLEHIITVQATVLELNAVCDAQTVVINDLMSVRTRGSVHHLGSRVTGQLAAGNDAWDAFDVLFPSITASGVPKSEALASIECLESSPRELYAGAVLWLDDNHFEAALVLRSAYQDDRRQWIQAGAGVIAQSTPARELVETREKLASIAPYLQFAAHKQQRQPDD